MRHVPGFSSVLLLLCAVGCSTNADVDRDGETSADSGLAADMSRDGASDASGDDQGVPDMVQDLSAGDAGMPLSDLGVVDIGEDAGLDMSADMSVAPPRGLCASVSAQGGRPSLPGTNPGAASPFGTGASNDVILGALANPGGPPQPISRSAVNLNQDLTTRTYDVYVPDAYDGSEPYGLVVFINSGNNGTTPNTSYLPQFQSDRLIQVAPDGAGNAINVDVRMGLALLGAARVMERFNIDPSRVYAMGNSGGARSAHMLSYQYPELFTGAMPRCGANYPRVVDQDYETQEPDGNYEFWGSSYFPMVNGSSYIDYLRTRSLRFALMTSFRDFREGDVFNIYHNGMQQDGLYSRLIEGPGGHCATSAAHFADAMGWIEHPLHQVVQDSFDGQALAASWLPVRGEVTLANGELELSALAQSSADVVLGERVQWKDSHGVVIQAMLDLDAAPQGVARVALWPFDGSRHVTGAFDPPTALSDARRGVISVSVERDDATAHVVVEVARQGEERVEVFRAKLEAWSPDGEPLRVRIDAWESELQIDLGWHLQDVTSMEGAALLNDRRTIRTRWDALLPDGWGETDWTQGSVMTLSVEGGTSTAALHIDELSVHDAAGFICEP